MKLFVVEVRKGSDDEWNPASAHLLYEGAKAWMRNFLAENPNYEARIVLVRGERIVEDFDRYVKKFHELTFDRWLNAILDAREKLKEIAASLGKDYNEVVAHAMAEDVLCELLHKLGADEVAELFEELPKWYEWGDV